MDDLIRHSAWLKRLAHSLVKDPHLADDLVQETWVSALENPPHHASNHRSWLGRVLRNRVASYFRSNTRRTAREQSRAAQEEAHALANSRYAQEVVERGEISQLLAEAVMDCSAPCSTSERRLAAATRTAPS